jgi:heme-degrading monooxygenase HmoA
MYVSIWEFQVAPDAEDRFRHEYGPDGGWAALFRRAPGYVSTTLLRDHVDPLRFLTVDVWESEEAHEAFRREFALAYAEHDDACRTLTLRELPVGRFTAPDGVPPLP